MIRDDACNMFVCFQSSSELQNDLLHYDLFSVVIHKGAAHGGHYHAYIQDVDALGNWSHPVSIGVCQRNPCECYYIVQSVLFLATQIFICVVIIWKQL